MEIIAVTTAAHAQSFLDMVQIIYQNDDVYVRPLDIEINNIFNPATNNFHQHGEAARWILKDGNKIIGRVAAFKLEVISAPAYCKSFCELITIFLLLGKALPIDSKVFRPIIMALPDVTFLKKLKSLGKCHSNWLSLPMALF